MELPAIVTLTFDDGFRSQFENALPILDRYGINSTFFLIANKEPTHDRWSGQHNNDWWKVDWSDDDIAMLKKVLATGHEIGSHSVTHHPATMATQPDVETREAKHLIEKWLGIPVSSFCYPFYRSHAYLANAVKNSGYQQARGGGIPPSYGPRSSFYPVGVNGGFDKFNVDCRQISSHESVQKWLRPGCWHVLTYHGIGGPRDGWEPIPVSEFERHVTELARFRDSGNVQVATFKDGAKALAV
jgi:peptidoglycan/xylan/chitin deacetylase (PgdA/CDA1 family)